MRTTATSFFPINSNPRSYHALMEDSGLSRTDAVAASGRGSTDGVSAGGGGLSASSESFYQMSDYGYPAALYNDNAPPIVSSPHTEHRRKTNKGLNIRTAILSGSNFESCSKKTAFSAEGRSSQNVKRWPCPTASNLDRRAWTTSAEGSGVEPPRESLSMTFSIPDLNVASAML
jgi:hypothetical protein